MQTRDNIISFGDKEEFSDFLRSKCLVKKLGEGSEGVCYLSSLDNSVYKIISHSLEEYTGTTYCLEEIITTKDIELKSFAFPMELYALSKTLLGYKTKYVAVDLFDYYNSKTNYKNIYKIDFDKLLKAYYYMLKDIEKLSSEKIKIYDLGCNLMFTGEFLVGIDTGFYQRVLENPFERNKRALEDAIRDVFDCWLEYNFGSDEVANLMIEEDIEKYFKGIDKVTKKVKKKLLI